jgi:hypothetical protein
MSEDGNGQHVLSGQVVPFGKYKGRSVAELAADDGYREWVLAQPWVRERYTVFYNVLVQGTPPPQDSPEHNEMQARFLDEAWCLGLVRCLKGLSDDGLGNALDQVTAWQKTNKAINPAVADQYEIEPAEVSGTEFEHKGWDVFFTYEPAGIQQHWQCPCGITRDEEQLRRLWLWNRLGSPYFSGSSFQDTILSEAELRDDSERPREPRKPYIAKPVAPELRSSAYPPSGYYSSSGPSKADVARYQAELASYPERMAKYQDELADAEAALAAGLARYPEILDRYAEQRHYALDHRDHENYFQIRSYPVRIAAELKPDLGDDYPAVLRQVQGYLTERVSYGRGAYGDHETCDAAFVVTRRAQFRSVTWEQVQKIFAASGILLVCEDNVAQKASPAYWYQGAS